MRAKRFDEGGRFDKQVTLQTTTDADDGAGGRIQSFAAGTTLWAEVRALSAVEIARFSANLELRITHEFKLRWRTGIVRGMRLTFRGVMYRIESVSDPAEDKRTMTLLAWREGDA